MMGKPRRRLRLEHVEQVVRLLAAMACELAKLIDAIRATAR